jgi:hypothetical protein
MEDTIQEALVGLGHRLNQKTQGKTKKTLIQTEHEAAVHITEGLARFLRLLN